MERIEMNRRKLGNSGLEISPLVFGGNVFGWTADEPSSFKLLDAFVAAGFNAIDTADVYSKWAPGHTGGESETILGKWLKRSGNRDKVIRSEERRVGKECRSRCDWSSDVCSSDLTADVYSKWAPGHTGGESETILGKWLKRSGNRDKVIVATKVGMEMAPGKKGLSRSYILRAAEDSLQRLQTDYIDLYQSHSDDADTPLEETLGTYAELIAQGKVRAIGASNYTADRFAAALEISKKTGLPRYQSLQPHYNLYERAGFETELALLCLRENI